MENITRNAPVHTSYYTAPCCSPDRFGAAAAGGDGAAELWGALNAALSAARWKYLAGRGFPLRRRHP